ncbi:hypothetical protein AB0D89_32850 [Streptomyces luteogriseus]|uniref:hypothetical protein n=1 Tax=Streptomyces luteogriseus TaxID=68233 RepID=UPI0033EFE0BB
MAQGVTHLLEPSSRCRSFALAGELSRGKPALLPAERVLLARRLAHARTTQWLSPFDPFRVRNIRSETALKLLSSA